MCSPTKFTPASLLLKKALLGRRSGFLFGARSFLQGLLPLKTLRGKMFYNHSQHTAWRPGKTKRFLPEIQTCWWLNQPIWQICSSNWIISTNRDENKNIWNHPAEHFAGRSSSHSGGLFTTTTLGRKESIQSKKACLWSVIRAGWYLWTWKSWRGKQTRPWYFCFGGGLLENLDGFGCSDRQVI